MGYDSKGFSSHGIDLGSLHGSMPEQFLNGSNICPTLKHMSGKTVAEHMGVTRFSIPAFLLYYATAFDMNFQVHGAEGVPRLGDSLQAGYEEKALTKLSELC